MLAHSALRCERPVLASSHTECKPSDDGRVAFARLSHSVDIVTFGKTVVSVPSASIQLLLRGVFSVALFCREYRLFWFDRTRFLVNARSFRSAVIDVLRLSRVCSEFSFALCVSLSFSTLYLRITWNTSIASDQKRNLCEF